MKTILVLAMVGVLSACGTVPLPKTGACLQKAEQAVGRGLTQVDREASRPEAVQRARNECWYNKGAGKD